MQKIEFLEATTITSTLKRAHSKALESGCLLRFSLPEFDYEYSLSSEGRGHPATL